MRKIFYLAVSIVFLIFLNAVSLAYEEQIKMISSDLTKKIEKTNRRVIGVVDFTDLQGNVTELGRFLAEELSTTFETNKGFEVVDRSYLKTLLEELQLTQTGLVDDSSASRNFGKISGVEALIIGAIAKIGDSIRLTVKVLDTTTLEVIGASRGDIPVTKAIEELLAKGIDTSSQYPLFPWPPPRASSAEVIPRKMLEVDRVSTRLRDVDERISKALEQNGYSDRSYYAVPAWFALVTKMEQIDPDGTSKKGQQRWCLVPRPLSEFSLAAYLRALFRATPGFYRVIVLVITPYAFTRSEVGVAQEDANIWLRGGLNRLPSAIGELNFSQKDYACTALIYEFERATEAETPKFCFPGRIPARVHLVKAGIWEVLKQ